MTKIEAIAHIENAMKGDAKFQKKLADYIRIIAIDELSELKVPNTKVRVVANKISIRVLRLFQANWWKAQKEG